MNYKPGDRFNVKSGVTRFVTAVGRYSLLAVDEDGNEEKYPRVVDLTADPLEDKLCPVVTGPDGVYCVLKDLGNGVSKTKAVGQAIGYADDEGRICIGFVDHQNDYIDHFSVPNQMRATTTRFYKFAVFRHHTLINQERE